LTIPEIYESLPHVKHSKLAEKEAFCERFKNLNSYYIGLQVASGSDPKYIKKRYYTDS